MPAPGCSMLGDVIHWVWLASSCFGGGGGGGCSVAGGSQRTLQAPSCGGTKTSITEGAGGWAGAANERGSSGSAFTTGVSVCAVFASYSGNCDETNDCESRVCTSSGPGCIDVRDHDACDWIESRDHGTESIVREVGAIMSVSQVGRGPWPHCCDEVTGVGSVLHADVSFTGGSQRGMDDERSCATVAASGVACVGTAGTLRSALRAGTESDSSCEGSEKSVAP